MPSKKGQKRIDWEAVEPLYCMGIMSIPEITRQYAADHKTSAVWAPTVTEWGVRKKAKEEGWQRNIAHKVKDRVKENLARIDVENAKRGLGLSEKQLIERAAKIPTEIRRLQRSRAVAIADLGDRLYEKLTWLLGTQDPARASELAAFVKIYDKLVGARMKLQQMESNAFGLDEIKGEDIEGIKIQFVGAS